MLKRITIDNFRGFKKLDLTQDLGPVVVLMGPNSSGKTTVLQAIRLVCQLLEQALANEEVVLKRGAAQSIDIAKDLLIDSPSSLLPLLDWQAMFLDQKVGQGTSFSIDLKFDQQIDAIEALRLSVSYARNQQIKYSLTAEAPGVPGRSSSTKTLNQDSDLLKDWFRDRSPKAVFVPPFYGVVRDEEYRQRVVVDKLVGSGDQSHVVRNLVVGLENHQLDRLNAFLRELVGAEIVYRTSGDRIETESPLRIEFKDSNGKIEISAAGAGLINLISLYASLARWQSTTDKRTVMFLLDEPEAHLHPRLQGRLAERMVSLVTKEFKAQVFMATHSVEMINALGENLDASLLRTSRTTEPSVLLLNRYVDILDDLAEWADLTPFSAINFMSARKVLFHEGSSDADILKKCAELKFRQLDANRRAFELWTLVSLQGSGNEKIVDSLVRLLDSSLWTKSVEKKAFVAITVLDCDSQRDPGWSEPKQVKNSSLSFSQFVWSRYSIESLFIEPAILSYWVKPLVGDSATLSDLQAWIRDAIEKVDDDEGINVDAEWQLLSSFKKTTLFNEKGEQLARGSDPHLARAYQLTKKFMKENEPAVYQRGKDRAAKVLGYLKMKLFDLGCKNNLPADLAKLIDRADTNQISDPVKSLPPEINQLLDQMIKVVGGD